MKKFYAVLGMTLLFSTISVAQTAEQAAPRHSREEMALRQQERMKEKMAEKLATLDQAQLMQQKKRLETILAQETNEKKAEYLKLRLEVINSLLK